MSQKMLFFSLGGSCIAALQLRRRNLRVCSLPFDWLFHVDNSMWDSLSENFKNDFSGWMISDNMEELKGQERGTSNLFQYKDTSTGFRFIHDFHNTIDSSGEYRKVYKKYTKRIKRLYHMIDQADQVLMVANTKWCVDLERIKKFFAVVSSKWEGKKIHLFLVNFNDTENCRIDDGSIAIIKCTRSENKYDYFETNFEWEFLDEYVEQKKKNRFFSISFSKKAMHINIFNFRLPVFQLKFSLFGLSFDLSLGLI